MSRARSDAMFERIGAHAKVMGALLKRLYRNWRGPERYRPGAHYMRGPGPKWHDKQARGSFDCDPPQRPS
ncbi:hypothetical protein HNR60_002915 [Rhodopseudomonas rhenobacensis]|uniref:Uncharacterized protein n=1 Tax=Rhodopseudomonas rhenobacensis TaxID=87461 RepID=A0A7W8DZL0_9BRAD|nr:hypothetical protein [Rhodopseudomonas rhenobacensis]MBB5048153.1 hypothetical protein [Rhodopseudomonas rhenobacensis]